MRRFFLTTMLGVLVTAAFGGLTGAAWAGGLNIERVKAGGTDVYTRYFLAGEVIRVGVSGNGFTDLDLYVYCPCKNKKLIARDEDETDDCLVSVRAPESGFYTIKVVNRSSLLSNVYAIAVDD
jgi:hypothetical protein